MPIGDEKVFDEKPNPNASVGFVIFFPFQFFVERPIYEAMRDQSEFIIDGGSHPFGKIPPKLIEDMVALLDRYGASYRIIYNSDYLYPEYLGSFLKKYEALVSLWERGCLSKRESLGIKKICLAYGAGKELTMVRPGLGAFDLVLTFGSRDTKLFGLYAPAVTVGNPKFDAWFQNKIDEKILSAVKGKISSQKKTILYLPTHSDLCSIGHVASELKKITSLYNVIVKLHYYTPREEPHLVDALRHPGIVLFQDDTDLLPLLKVADVVLSDNSSAIFDAILADRPVVVADFWDKDYLDNTHKERRQYNRGFGGAITFSGSIEQQIKRDGTVSVLRVPDELPLKILESFRRVIEKKDRLDALREELFSFNDGRSAERARDEVVECLRSDIGEKPILYHAFEAYKRTIGIASYEYIKRVKEKLNVYENALVNTHEQPPAFLSVILVDRHPEYLADTLKSLIWQKYPSERYEVIVITRRSEKEFTEILQTVFGEANKTSFVYVAQKEDQYPSLSLSESIKRARGNEIVFTHSGCIPESDWLLQYSLWFRRMPNSLGIGGYEKRLEKTPKNIFFQYKDYEIAKNLGLRLWKRGPKNFYLVENDLFYQNPCGILSNTAYRKEALQEVDIASLASNSWVVLELVLKTRILTRGRLTFVPFPVGVEYRETSEEFRRMNIDTGIAYSYLSRFERNKGSILRITVTSILWEALVSVAGRYGGSRISLARTILIAGWYQWLGFRTSNLHYFVGKVTFRK